MPDTPWTPGMVYSNVGDELRNLGFVLAVTDETEPRGLSDVSVRTGSRLRITTDTDCTIDVYRCGRPIDYLQNLPTWNEYDPAGSGSWSSPGGLGDAAALGTLACTADTPAELCTAHVVSAVEAMLAGQPQSFLFRRYDQGYETISLAVELVVEFDLPSPPN
jgi:hypothetical protein